MSEGFLLHRCHSFPGEYVFLLRQLLDAHRGDVHSPCLHHSDDVTCWLSRRCLKGIHLSTVMQVPLFPGDCELRQLLHIFKLLGTPTEDQWAGVSQLRDWHEFPNWRKQSLAEHFPTLEPAGVDLLDAMFVYDPADRITVSAPLLSSTMSVTLLQAVCRQFHTGSPQLLLS